MGIRNIPFSILNKKITLNYHKSEATGFFPRDSKMSSKQPSVFEPSKFYCISYNYVF